MVPNLVTTVCHALEGNTASNLGCLLQLMTVMQVTFAQQKKTFVIQTQATFSVQKAIFAQKVRPIHSVVAQGHIKVVRSKCHVMIALKVITASQTPLIHWCVLLIITVLMGHTRHWFALTEHLRTAMKLD